MPLIIGCTEPSYFTDDVLKMIENFFEANPIKLSQNVDSHIYHWVDMCDAVILSGGSDIHPRLYRGDVLNDHGYHKFDVLRDIREMKIIRRCFDRDIPILGICRGHQMLGVYHALTFIQDLSESKLCHQPMSQKITFGRIEPMHKVKLTPKAARDLKNEIKMINSDMVDELTGPDAIKHNYLFVNSFHHQGLLYEPEYDYDVEVLATARGVGTDRIIEMMRGTKNRWISVQWHPEFDWMDQNSSRLVLQLFKNLLSKEKRTKSCKSNRQPKKILPPPPVKE